MADYAVPRPHSFMNSVRVNSVCLSVHDSPVLCTTKLIVKVLPLLDRHIYLVFAELNIITKFGQIQPLMGH